MVVRVLAVRVSGIDLVLEDLVIVDAPHVAELVTVDVRSRTSGEGFSCRFEVI